MPKSRLNRPSDADAIEARAAAWLAERDAGFSPAAQTEFAGWCRADPRHAAAVQRLAATWSALGQLRDFRPAARAHPDRDLLARPPLARAFAFPFLLAGAAAAAVVALLLTFSGRAFHWSIPPVLAPAQTYTTTAGGYQRVTLGDGSTLELNDNSEVRVRYTDDERRLQLVRGEAHFTVAKNKRRPFYVVTHAVAVRAVGTAFDVRLAQAAVEVLVTEGRVQLNRLPAGPPRNRATPLAASPTLDAGWRAVIPADANAGLVTEAVSSSQIRDALSWQGPRLVFVETPLAQVVEQFNQHNQVQISLGDRDLGSLPVGGSFRPENIEAFVRLLASNGDIAVERPAADRIVLRRVR